MAWTKIFTNRRAAAAGLVTFVLGVPGMLEDASIWQAWLGDMSPAWSGFAAGVGVMLMLFALLGTLDAFSKRKRFHALGDDLSDVGISAVTAPNDTEALQKLARVHSELHDLGVSVPDGKANDGHVANHFLKLAKLAKAKDLTAARGLLKKEE